jgi:hypothetical protein
VLSGKLNCAGCDLIATVTDGTKSIFSNPNLCWVDFLDASFSGALSDPAGIDRESDLAEFAGSLFCA